MKPIRLGSKGIRVKALQRRLNGYFKRKKLLGTWITVHDESFKIKRVTVDGDFGKATLKAVLAYEKHSNHTANGVIKRAEYRALRLGKLIARMRKNRKVAFVPAHKWGRRPHGAYSYGPKPLHVIFLHTSVTYQLSPNASNAEQAEQMRRLDDIAFARGFNGISYSWGVLPSGDIYEGRGFRVVEAATSDYNSSSDSVCTVGNTDVYEPTKDQIDSIVDIIKLGQKQGEYANKLSVRGHRSVAPKACPGAKFTDAKIAVVRSRVN